MRNLGLEQVAASTILKTILAAATWRAVGADNSPTPVACAQITVRNDSGATVSVGYGLVGAAAPVGEIFPLITGTSFTFRGLRSSGELYLQHTAGGVTVYAVAEAV